HRALTPEGFAAIEELGAGDQVMMAQSHRLSPAQWQFVRGSLLGDTCLSKPSKPYLRNIKIRLGHGAKQAAYLKWKVSIFANIPGSYWQRSSGKSFWDSTPLPELFDLQQDVYRLGVKYFSQSYLDQLTPFGLALWYMDDGSFTLRGKELDRGRIAVCVEGMSIDSQQRLVRMLAERYGIDCSLRDVREQAILRMEQPATARFHALVAEYIHPSMDYKLLPRFRGRFGFSPEFIDPSVRLVPAVVADVRPKRMSKYTPRSRFDIEVDGTHNYLVDGVVVHNSPITTTGGKALKFYASMRLDVAGIEQIKNGTDVIGRRVRVKVVKNKVAPPFRIAELEILAVEGISREGGLVDMGLLTGVVTKYGAWFNYGETRLGQGRENAKQFFRDHPDVAAEVEAKVREKSGSVPVGGPDEES
ncbi:MAG: intein-containing recombinase RecA, partial [Candidatus Limnocylindria bacterium]